ncbi:MAG: proline dehydrogenase family protein, partial [Planctomycetales bacterium]
MAAVEASTQEVGRELFEQLQSRQPSVFERRWWNDRILSWAMRDESVKVQMFRFIDVLPMLTTSDEIVRHLHEYFEDVKKRLPAAARLAMAAAPPNSLTGRALAVTARRNASSHARRFIAGTNAAEVLAAAMRQRKLKRAFTLDILGEAVISDAEAEKFLQSYVDLLQDVAPTANGWPDLPQIDQGVLNELPRVNLSVKLSALDAHFDPIDPEGVFRRVGPRLRKLLRVAREHRAFINVDMESYHVKDLTFWLFKKILMEDEFRETGDVGIVVQAYLRDSERDLVALRDWAKQRGKPIWVRLVKGAYWDYETVIAGQHGWPVPVYSRKHNTDANYERLTRLMI